MRIDKRLIQLYALKTYGESGPKSLQNLLVYFGSFEGIIRASLDELVKVQGISKLKARKLLRVRGMLKRAEEDLSLIQKAGIMIISVFDEEYPPRLLKIGDPPSMIFYRGRLPKFTESALAVVGTAKPSEKGISAAVEIGKLLASRGITVVSGLASGIDASAHIGSLKADGYTVAILGSGLLNIYPKENIPLANMVEQSGCLMSEFHPEAKVSKGQLIARNRLIVALSSAIIAVELSDDSNGTLNAIKRANEQGKVSYLYDPLGKLSIEGQAHSKVVSFRSIDELEELLEYLVISGD